ncbi:hypothetical protein, partial [Streptomyces sp. NPDC002088]|uniref:hypothetical protein n=1 Tax=Streptomyces sp. NPDC002088 TaxID=3154665 RepID=UPI00332DC6E4
MPYDQTAQRTTGTGHQHRAVTEHPGGHGAGTVRGHPGQPGHEHLTTPHDGLGLTRRHQRRQHPH